MPRSVSYTVRQNTTTSSADAGIVHRSGKIVPSKESTPPFARAAWNHQSAGCGAWSLTIILALVTPTALSTTTARATRTSPLSIGAAMAVTDPRLSHSSLPNASAVSSNTDIAGGRKGNPSWNGTWRGCDQRIAAADFTGLLLLGDWSSFTSGMVTLGTSRRGVWTHTTSLRIDRLSWHILDTPGLTTRRSRKKLA